MELGMRLSLVLLGGISHDVPFLKYEPKHVKDSVAECRVGHGNLMVKKVGCKISSHPHKYTFKYMIVEKAIGQKLYICAVSSQ